MIQSWKWCFFLALKSNWEWVLTPSKPFHSLNLFDERWLNYRGDPAKLARFSAVDFEKVLHFLQALTERSSSIFQSRLRTWDESRRKLSRINATGESCQDGTASNWRRNVWSEERMSRLGSNLTTRLSDMKCLPSTKSDRSWRAFVPLDICIGERSSRNAKQTLPELASINSSHG
jgi:hypothetical protein